MDKGVIKPKSQRHKRLLKQRAPKIHENDKKCLIIRGGNTSETVTDALKDIYSLKKPNAIMFKKRNVTRPFEDTTSLQFLTKMNDCSLFLFGSHSKKRPHNFVIGRLFEHQMLDMVELGIDKFEMMKSIKSDKCSLATKPCLIFNGTAFESDDELRRLKSVFMDFFRGPVVTNVRLSGLEHVLSFTAVEGKVFLRSYRVALKKSGTRIPRIELQDMGPNIDFTVRRAQLSSNDLYKKACKQPRAAKPKKVKNISGDMFGTKRGRIHMTSQDLETLQLRKVKALKRKNDKKLNISPTKEPKLD